jgi:HlyD family secretion protein
MKKRSKKLLIGGIIAVAVIVVVLNITGNGKRQTSVHIKDVEVRDLTEEVSASGWVQPQTRVNITSQVTAEIIEVPVKEGQIVLRGDLLVLLDTVQLQKDVDQTRYSLDEMKARTQASRTLYLQAEEEYERQKELFERQLISETIVDNANYSYKNRKFSHQAMVNQTKQAKARYEKALDNLSKTRIAAPMNGVLTFLDAEVGEIAAAQTPYTQGKTLMTISNLATFEVEVDVDETEIIKVEIGQSVKIEVDAFPDTVFNGEVVEIGNTAVISGRGSTDQSTDFKVKVLFIDTSVAIKPGMSATVDIVSNERTGVLAVPYGAIVMRTLDIDSLERANNEPTEGSDSADDPPEEKSGEADTTESDKKKEMKEMKGVFLVEDEKAKFVPVQTGIADQKEIEIISGLVEGDTIITGPYRILRTIKSGEDIKPIKDSKDEDS